jgi:hypothetical protein
MYGLFCFVLVVLASPFKSKGRLEGENAVLAIQFGAKIPAQIFAAGIRIAALSNFEPWF